MLDIRFIRENAKVVEEKARQKGYSVDVSGLLELDDRRRELQTKADEIRQRRNVLADEAKGGRPTEDQIERGKALKSELAEVEDRLRVTEDEYVSAMYKVPNVPLDYVPVGATEDENVVEKTVGEPTVFAFEPKNHAEVAALHGWLDKERAAKISGSRFAYLKGGLVQLQFAIVQFVMNALTNEETLKQIIADNNLDVSAKAFVPVIPPAMIRTEPYEGSARLDREEVTYKIEQDDLWLNASAEHSLVPMYMDEILPEAELPIRYIGYSTSFRREAGTYGKDMEGMFRMHQFDKLEMEVFSMPEAGLGEHKLMIAIQEYFMQQLGLPYRVLQKCTADIGFANAAGVDIETWLPGQGKYRETHSADYMTDYQSRRLKMRVRREDGTVELLHTNDATALVLSRIPVAIIENYQQADGSVKIPDVLRPYLGGRETI